MAGIGGLLNDAGAALATAIQAGQDPVYGGVPRLNEAPASYNRGQQGVFALHPLATPKYALNNGLRDGEFRDTLARIYISLADAAPATQAAYLDSLPTNVKELGKVLVGSNTQGGTGFIDFFLTSVQESFQEIVQVDKVLADDYVAFFYGQQPPMFQYSGVLLNSMQDDQRSGFARAYATMLRGTQLARRGALARLRYDSVIVSGTMTATSQMIAAENELAVQFSFTFLVKEYAVLNNRAFNKVTAAQYVQIAADAELAKLKGVGAIRDTRVRATMVPPPVLAGESVATAPPRTLIASGGGGTDGRTLLAAGGTSTAVSEALETASALADIYGTVTPSAPTPPPPYQPPPR